MTRTVADAALMLQIIAGADAKDRTCTADPVPDYASALGGDLKGLRIGVPRALLHRRRARGRGCRVPGSPRDDRVAGRGPVEVDVPHARYATSAGWIVAMAEAAQFHEKRLRETPQLFDPMVRERLDAARLLLRHRLHQGAARAHAADGRHGEGARPVRCHRGAREHEAADRSSNRPRSPERT